MDLRVPSGLFFAATGLILMGVGLFVPGAVAPMTDININLYVGLAMLAFGGILLLLARRSLRL